MHSGIVHCSFDHIVYEMCPIYKFFSGNLKKKWIDDVIDWFANVIWKFWVGNLISDRKNQEVNICFPIYWILDHQMKVLFPMLNQERHTATQNAPKFMQFVIQNCMDFPNVVKSWKYLEMLRIKCRIFYLKTWETNISTILDLPNVGFVSIVA